MREWIKQAEDSGLAIRIALAFILIWGVVMSFLVPPWQTPDEHAHLRMIGESLGNEDMAYLMLYDIEMDLTRIMNQYEEKVDRGQWEEALTKAPDYSRGECMPKSLSPSVIKHLPATVGVVLGILLHLPTFWVLELGELFSLMFYVAVCGFAIKLMPAKKEALLLFMAFPMAVQQASSLNYDAVLLPLCFLFIAYLFYLRCEKDRLGWKEAGLTLLLLALIVYIKLPYLFLGLLVFLLPKEKIHLPFPWGEINGEVIRKWRVPAGIVLLFLTGAGVYAARSNFWVNLVSGMALEWRQSLRLFWLTAVFCKRHLLISSVGKFGWMESGVSLGFVLITYLWVLILAVCKQGKEEKPLVQKKSGAYLWMVFLILCIFIALSMVNHTIKVSQFGGEDADVTYNVREMIYNLPYIGGLQGRYFLPFLPLPFLTLPEKIRIGSFRTWLPVVYMIIAMAVSFAVLYQRYWI